MSEDLTTVIKEKEKEIICLLEEIEQLKEDSNVKLTQTIKARYEIILESLQRENDILRVRTYDLTQKENQLNAIIHSRLYRLLVKIKKVIRRR